MLNRKGQYIFKGVYMTIMKQEGIPLLQQSCILRLCPNGFAL